MTTAHGLSPEGEIRLCRLDKIAERLAEIEVEKATLYAERTQVFAECRLDNPAAPTELLAQFAHVTDAAVLHQLRAEEERRGLERGALGRKAKRPAA